MIVLWVWIGAVVVALVVLGIVGYDLIGRLRRFQRASAELRTDRIGPARTLVDGIQLTRSSGRHSAELRLDPVASDQPAEWHDVSRPGA